MPRRGGASAGRPPNQGGMSAICSPTVRPPAHAVSNRAARHRNGNLIELVGFISYLYRRIVASGGLRGPILAGCQRQGFGFRTVRYRQPSRTKTRQRASLSHGALHMITRTKGPPRRRFLNSSWLVELTPLTNGSGPFPHRDNRDNPSWRSTRWLFPNRLDDAKNC